MGVLKRTKLPLLIARSIITPPTIIANPDKSKCSFFILLALKKGKIRKYINMEGDYSDLRVLKPKNYQNVKIIRRFFTFLS